MLCWLLSHPMQWSEAKKRDKTLRAARVCLQMVSKCDICSICRRKTFTYLHILCFLPQTISCSNIATVSNVCKITFSFRITFLLINAKCIFPINSVYLKFLFFALLGMSCLSVDLCNELTKYWKNGPMFTNKMTDVRQKCNMYATPVFCESDGKIPIEKARQRQRRVYTKMQNMKSIEYLWQRYLVQHWENLKDKNIDKLNILRFSLYRQRGPPTLKSYKTPRCLL